MYKTWDELKILSNFTIAGAIIATAVVINGKDFSPSITVNPEVTLREPSSSPTLYRPSYRPGLRSKQEPQRVVITGVESGVAFPVKNEDGSMSMLKVHPCNARSYAGCLY